MQTALCYLEAVRPKVPDILHDQKLGVRAYFMPESAILPATEAELQMDRKLEGSDSSTSDDLLKTVRLTDEDTDLISDHCEMVGIAPEPSVLTTAFPPSESLPHVSSRPHTCLKNFSGQMLLKSCMGQAIWTTTT